MSRVLFRGGTVVTFDQGRHSALVIDAGRIVAVGGDELSGEVGFDQVVELDGARSCRRSATHMLTRCTPGSTGSNSI